MRKRTETMSQHHAPSSTLPMVAHMVPSQGPGVQGEVGVSVHCSPPCKPHKGTRTRQTHSEVYIFLAFTNHKIKLLLGHLEQN